MRATRLRIATAVVALVLGAAAAESLAAANSDVPVVELHLDAIGGGTTPDSSGNNLSATAQGTLVSDGRFDHALRMSAAGNAVNVANHPLLAPAQVTVMAWVRQTGHGFDQFLVGKPYPAAGCNTDSYALTSGLTSGVRFIVDVASPGPKQYSTPESSTGSVWDGQWHAIAGTYDGSTVSLYQDGQLVGSTPTDGSPLIYDTSPGNAALAGLYSGIPSNPNNCVFDQKYSGDIDEIRVYDHALSAQEIAKLQAPSATTPPRLVEPPPPLTLPSGGEPVGGLPGGALGVDTRILSGPTQVISGAPRFTFDATVAGATFQCWIDNGAPAPCTSPFTRYGLRAGKHTFFVKASAGGRGDLTPASWPFTIGTTVRKGTCVDVVIKFPGPVEICTPVKVACPLGAACTVKGVAVELRDKDVKFRSELIVSGTVGAGPYAGVTCNNHPEITPSFSLGSDLYKFVPCPKEFTITRIGDGGAARVDCQWGDFTDTPGEYRLGPEADRLYTCTGEVTTTPAQALVVVGTGTTTPGTIVTAPGKLTLTGRTTGTSPLGAAARKPPAPFKPLSVTAKAAGPAQLPFKLTSAAKRALKKTGRLSVAMTVSFTPAGTTKAIVRRQRFTFTTAPKPIKAQRRKPRR